jgi:pimeloyl-ACP methyl ester carboxylesterase
VIVVRSQSSPTLRALLWFHGFNADAETHRPELERFARGGVDAFGIDAVGHGSRRWPDLDAIVAAPHDEAKRKMLEMVDATASEVPGIVASLLSDGYESVSIGGVSMGGYVVYRALLLEPRIHSAVALLGSPEGLDYARFAGLRLLSITAEHDENVPPDAARFLHHFLGNASTNYLELAGVGHLLHGASWEYAIDATAAWIAGDGVRLTKMRREELR